MVDKETESKKDKERLEVENHEEKPRRVENIEDWEKAETKKESEKLEANHEDTIYYAIHSRIKSH